MEMIHELDGRVTRYWRDTDTAVLTPKKTRSARRIMSVSSRQVLARCAGSSPQAKLFYDRA